MRTPSPPYSRLDLAPPSADQFIFGVAPLDYGPVLPSRLREFHPEALTDSGREPLDSSGSCHRVETAVSRQDRRFLPFPVALPILSSVTHPPSLHRNYPASSLLRSSPSLAGASVLSASRFPRLCLLRYHRPPGSQVPYQSPNEIHAAYTPDTAWSVGRYPPCSFPGQGDAPGFDVI